MEIQRQGCKSKKALIPEFSNFNAIETSMTIPNNTDISSKDAQNYYNQQVLENERRKNK